MKKLINLLKGFLQKGPSEVEQRNAAFFEEKLRSMKVELVSEKSECCKTPKAEEAKVNPKPPVKKPVAKKPAKLDQVKADAERMQKKPVAKKPAPKKPKAE
jgi:hypothetical protein